MAPVAVASSPEPAYSTTVQRGPIAWGVVLPLVVVKFLLHLVTIFVSPYGIHRDELLYLAMGQHLDFWGMDAPPGIAVVAGLVQFLFGDTLFGVRIVPALMGTLLVLLAALIAREFGGGKFAQGLAALAVLANPLFLRAGTLFQPVVLDQVWWTLALLALVWIARRGSPRAWLVFGVACGLGLLTKFSLFFFGAATLVGLLLSPQRRALRTPWPWAAALVALVIGSASLVGQVRLGFPVFGQMEALQMAQLDRITPMEFLVGNLLFGPGTLLGLVGMGALLGAPRFRAFRVVGWTTLAAFVLLLAMQGKAYYFGPAYPALFAAGAVWFEGRSGGWHPRLVRGTAVAVLFGFALVILPLGVPILGPEPLAWHVRTFGLTEALRTNEGEIGRLPQDYADMLGWEEQVAAVAGVYDALPPAQREAAVMMAANYGEAGALDFYGPRYGLPGVISPHTSYWFFGPGGKPGDVLLTVGIPPEALRPYYETVRLVARHTHPWAVEEEQDVPICVATGPVQSLQALWPSLAGRY